MSTFDTGAIVAGIIGEGIGDYVSDQDGLLAHPVNVTLFGAVEGLLTHRLIAYSAASAGVAMDEGNVLWLTAAVVALHRVYRHLYLPHLISALRKL
jgi:hypothetical protein